MANQARTSAIRELSIKGIRSFGPEDEQKITFDTPLTLILGSNGTGKTTIIECLKYITTNPDTNKSKILIQHPQVAGKSKVVGQVRLDLTTVTGDKMTVERSVKATEQQTKDITATMSNTVITRENEDQKTFKGAQLELQMEKALGVSKPVLDNVIFCHHEDSCWPLSESSTLKKKFDAIFNTEHYNSALKDVLDEKTKKEDTLKKGKDDITQYKKYKEDASKMREDLDDHEKSFAKVKEEKIQLEKDLKDINEQITATEKERKNVQEKQNTLDIKNTQKKEKETSIKKLRDRMGPELKDTEEELKKQQSDFERKIQECEHNLKEFERRSKELAGKLDTLNREKSSLLVDVGKLRQEAETHKKSVDDRNAKVCDWASEYGLEGFEQESITDKKCHEFLETIRQRRATLDKEYRGKKENLQKQKEDLQVEIRSASMRKEELEQRCKVKEDIGQKKAKADPLPKLVQELQKVKKDLDMAEKSVVLGNLKREITQLDQEQHQLDEDMNKLNSDRNRLTMLEEIHQIKAKHEKALTDLLRSGADVSVEEQHSDCMSEQTKREEDKVKGLEKREAAGSGNQTFDNCLQDAWKKLSDIQEKRGSLLEKRLFLQEYLSGENPVCHFCHCNFENSTVAGLKDELEGQLKFIGTELPKTEKELANHQKRYEDIVRLQPIREKLLTIQEQGLPDLRSYQEKISEDIRHLKDWIEKKQGELTLEETCESMGREIQPGIVLIDGYQKELLKVDEKMAVHSAGDSTRTLEMVVKEQKKRQERLDAVIQKLKEKLQTDSLGLEELHNRVRELKDKKLNIEEALQHRTTLEERQKTLEELSSLKEKVKECNSKKVEVEKKMETDLKADKDAIESIKEKERKIAEINEAIIQYKKEIAQKKLEEKENALAEVEKEETMEKTNRDTLTAEVDKANFYLATQKSDRRELLDNQDLRELQKCVGELDKEIAEREQELNDLDPKKLERDLNTLKEMEDDLKTKLTEMQGRQQRHEFRIEDNKHKLQESNYRNADEEYRKRAIQLRTTQLVVEDLNKYYQALDRAIMNYHTQKMMEINQVIREMWQKTYRGKDIEKIKIELNPDGGQEKRKTYNYCVKMVQGGAELEMRGRCSAGQKMLASIIIRLALAETLCMNCGVFALDEPTTNLDRENFDSLAQELNCIMEAREGRNFQLLVITHSIDFAEHLRRAEMTEFVWKVSKDENGHSKIEKRSIQELE